VSALLGFRMSLPSSSGPVAATSRRFSGLRRAARPARIFAAFALLAFSVAALSWLTLHWGLLPRLDQWRPQIEQRLAAAIGVPVRIGMITVESRGWVPAFALHDVTLLDGAGRPALRLGKVRAALAPQSLLVAELRLAQLHVEGVALDVRRDARGRIHVAGLDLAALPEAGTGDEQVAADWLLAQHEIVVRHGRVRWTDETRSAPPLELTGVDLVLRNGLRRHEFRLDASPEADWGDRVALRASFVAPLLARRSDWRRWDGTLFAHAPRVDVAQLGWYVALPFELNQGRGAVRAWLELRQGRWRELTADLSLADVWLRLQPALQPLAVAGLSSRVVARRDADGVQIEARELAISTGADQEWPAGDLRLGWRQAQDLGPPTDAGAGSAGPAHAVTGGQLAADRIDLGLLADAAGRLPLPQVVVDWLATLKPAGLVSGLQLRWQGRFESPDSYAAQGRVERLVLSASRPQPTGVGRPGITGAGIEFQLDQAGGRAALKIDGGALEFPGVFEQGTMPFDMLSANLDWRIEPQPGAPPAIELKVSNARFANDDVEGEARATWRTGRGAAVGAGGRYPGQLDLAGTIRRARADRVAAYLPLAISPVARRYVERSVKGGTLEEGVFEVRGDLWQFPFHEGAKEDVFRFTGRVRDAGFDYMPSVPAGSDEAAWESPWPGFQAVAGELAFERTSMRLSGMQARLWGVQLRNITARVDDLVHRPVLQVEGEGRGPAADLLGFVDATPVGRWIGGGLRPLTATGAAELRLALAIPLFDTAQSTVRGSVQLAGNDIRVQPGTPLLAGVRGRVDFTHRGFAIGGATARVFGGEAGIEGGTQPDGSLRFSAQGVASAEGLRRTAEIPGLAAVAAVLRGQAAYRASLALAGGWPELTVTSDLVGIETDLPPPLAKAAATVWPMRWQNTVQRDAAVGAAAGGSAGGAADARDTVRLDIGEIVQVRVQRRLTDEGAAVTAGAVGVFEPPPPWPGRAAAGAPATWQARANLDALDVDAWRRALDRLSAAGAVGGEVPPLRLTLRTGVLAAASRRLTRVQADIVHDPAARDARWSAQVSADQGQGRVQWQPAPDGSGAGRLVARLARLTLPPPEPGLSAAASPAQPAATRLPALDVAIDEFRLGDRSLGRLELNARQDPAPPRTGAWQLERLWLDLPGAQLRASGQWTPPGAGTAARMALDFGLELSDPGALAARFGMTGAVRGGRGTVKGHLEWPGSPLQPTLSSLEGDLQVALESGQFLRAEPGAARLMGILSLQSLPRRLLGDFRDVFDEGFAFDNVRGDVQVARGQARTDNLRMRGVQAVVAMAGTADLQRQTQDLRVVIVPEINAATASLAYAAINPAIGLGTFLAQLLLREPLAAAGTREFHVTGAWDEPRVEQIERPLEAVPQPDAPPPRKEPPG
jgi:uncharacterized protein (TIGR02099 family)